MFRPDDIDYSRLDVSAMLETRGIAAIDVLREQPCRRWLGQRSYDLATVDFGRSFKEVLAELGAILDWRGQFGYPLGEGEGNLNALADGFSFPISAERGRVLMVHHPETLASSHASWFDGFLEIASDHSLFHLACGSRFFVLLVLARESTLPGRAYGTRTIPSTYWNPNARRHGFVE
jgi:hypothetical protein